MTHANAPLSVEGRRRLIERCKTRPIAGNWDKRTPRLGVSHRGQSLQ
ncbi:hypothetical protein FBY35_0182 [Streptomyces sp. SLBN-118]|nr:hypothetical protein FBY35_0182 [Streptomyces sp. SLBN-118]